jgi:NitT/TauT family transport system substrate-binding protein
MRTFVLAAITTLAMSLPAVADEVRIGVGSYNLNNLPFPLAEGLGYYKDEGLEVTTENFASGGSKALQALVAGSTDIAVGFYDHTIQMQAQNKDVVAIVLLARNSGLVMAGRPDTTFDPAKPETIKGAKVGITAPGSSSDFFVRYYLQRNGLSSDDVSLIGVGSGSSAVAALEQGKVDVLVNYDPAATFIEEKGVGKILIDARSDAGAEAVYGGIYPTSTLYTTATYIKEHPEAVQKVVNATVRALKWIQEHSAADIVANLPEGFVSGDRETYTKAVERAKAIFSSDGKFNPEHLKTPLLVLQTFNEKVTGHDVDLSKTYTNQFVDAAGATN